MNKELLKAAGSHDIDKVKLLLQSGANPNIRDKHGRTALNIAADEEDLKIVKLLLKFGANPNIPNNDGMTPLMYAAYMGQVGPRGEDHVKITKLLLEHGADPNESTFENGKTALLHAHNMDIIKLLVKHGADVNARDTDPRSGETPLMNAVGSRNIELIKLLLKHGANPNIKNAQGDNAFKMTRDAEILELLSSGGRSQVIKRQKAWTGRALVDSQRSSSRSPSVSPVIKRQKASSRSSSVSPVIKRQKTRSSSVSPVIKRQKTRSSSVSPVIKRQKTASPGTKRQRSPSISIDELVDMMKKTKI